MELKKNGTAGILYRTNAPKLLVVKPTENAKNTEKTILNVNSGSFRI
jgi:hypothetical protein